MENATLLSPQERLAQKLDKYSVFRAVIMKSGLRFTSEPIDRQKAQGLLRNQPSGLLAIEGLRKDAFTPEEWETV